jgi:prepilin-type N-terminal cleavage/methylation domain-containing protein
VARLRIGHCGIRSSEFGDPNSEFGIQNSELKKKSEDSAIRNPHSAFQSGFTLIETIIVIVVLSIVSAVTINFLVSSLKTYSMMVNQKTLLDEGKLALERMCREIRDAQSISTPAAGGSGSQIIFARTHTTAQDIASETITFQLTGNTLEKVKTSPGATSPMAANVSAFTVTRGATEDEIKVVLTLALGGGENVTLQSKVYPKNLSKSAGYKNFFSNWEELSS